MKKKLCLLIIIVLVLLSTLFFLSPSYLVQSRSRTEKKLECTDCNLMIISLTNVRKDHVGLYGYSRKTTQNIDEFFKNSLIFNNAFAPASWTLPDAASFFTSLFPYAHGVMTRNKGSKLSDDLLTFPEILKNNDYSTAAFTGDGDYNSRFNLNQGFSFYLDLNNYKDFGETIRLPLGRGGRMMYSPIKAILPISINWLKSNFNKGKFFFFLQGYDAHCPFAATSNLRGKFINGLSSEIDFSECQWTDESFDPVYIDGKKYFPAKTGDEEVVAGTSLTTKKVFKDVFFSDEDISYLKALYDGAIYETDYYLKDLFKVINDLGLEKNTVFIFMAEHGDLMGEHGRFMRGGQQRGAFYEPVINFPMVIKHPKIKQPIVINDLVQTVDIMPTLLAMLGVSDPDSNMRQGNKLSLSVFGDKETNEYAFSGTKFSTLPNVHFNGISIIESVRNKEWKLTQEFVTASSTDELKTHKLYDEFHELYNIKEDPDELNNLYSSRNDVRIHLENQLNQWLEKTKKLW